MNFADIEAMWNSPQNQPTAAALERQKKELVVDLRRRRRGFVIFVTFVSALLTVVTLRLVGYSLWPAANSRPIDPSREWGALLLLLLPWCVPFWMVHQYRRHLGQHVHFQRSIPESVRALLDENRLARQRLKLVALLHGAVLLLLPLVVYQLRAVGKAGDEILVPAFVLWPLIATAIGISLWHYDRRKLRPRKQKLEALLSAHGNNA